MRIASFLVAVTIVVGWSASARAVGGPAAPWQHAVRLTGRVVDPASGVGIANVRLHVVNREGTVTTGDEGQFVFEALPPGRHRVVADLPGFVPGGPWEVTVSAAGTDVVLVYRLAVAVETVVAERLPKAPDVRPAVATSLERRQILAAAGALEDVSRVMQARPGVAASHDDRNDLLVRGGGAIETHTRLDGFDLPNASHFGTHGGTGGGLGLIAPWAIDRVSIDVGGFSVAYGERASSVVEIDVRDGRRDAVGGAASAGAGGAMGALDGPLPNGRGTWVAVARRSFLSLVLDRGRDRAVPAYGDLLAKTVWQDSHGRRVEVLALGGRGEVTVTSTRDPSEQLTDRQAVGLAGLRFDNPIGRRAWTTVAASAHVNDLDARFVDQGRLEFGDRSREVEVRLRGQVRQSIGRAGQWLAGLDVKRASLSFDLREDPYRNEFGLLVPGVYVDRRFAVVDVGAYVEASGPLLAGVRTTGGIRVDRPGGRGSWTLSPRVRVDRPIRGGVRVVGSFGAFRQAIPYLWMAAHPDNRGLDPVRSTQATAGIDWEAQSGVRIVAEAFWKRYRGYPVDPVVPSRVLVSALADFESPFVGRLVPDGQVRAVGADAGVTHRVAGRLEVALGYSWWRVSQLGLDGVWRPAEHDVRHQARIALQISRIAGWAGGLSWRYADGRPYTPFDTKASIAARGPRYDRLRINASRFPPYHRLDLRVDRAFVFGRRTLVLFAEVENVYNRDNVYVYEWSSSTREARPVYQWGRMPVGGARFEF